MIIVHDEHLARTAPDRAIRTLADEHHPEVDDPTEERIARIRRGTVRRWLRQRTAT